MATMMRCMTPACTSAARQPPACPIHAPSCSYTAAASQFLQGSTRLTAADCPKSHRSSRQRRSVITAVNTEDDEYQEEKFLEDYELLKAAGPPQGMRQEMFDENMEQYRQACKDPEARRRLTTIQESMSDPEVQQQMAQMQAVMQNKQIMQRMRKLKDDPDMADFFKELAEVGPSVLQKYMTNDDFLLKLNSKLGDIDISGAASAASGGSAPPGAEQQQIPDIENLLQAAKYGDWEATEDLIAVHHDVNDVDQEKRTPLHYAVAYRHMDIAESLLGAGADIEARDSKGNTPLHYAAGYGRGEFVAKLLQGGADGKAKNDNNHTPFGLVTMEQKNPLNQETETLDALKSAAGS